MSKTAKRSARHQEWDLSQLLPGASNDDSFTKKNWLVGRIGGKHQRVMKRIIQQAEEWQKNPDAIDYEKLHDMVDYLHVVDTFRNNLDTWLEIHNYRTPPGDNPEAAAHKAVFLKHWRSSREVRNKAYKALYPLVTADWEKLADEHPFIARSYADLEGKPKKSQPVPVESTIQYSRDIQVPYREYNRIFAGSKGGTELSDTQYEELAEIMTKATEHGWGQLRGHGYTSTDDVARSREENLGLPASLMREFSDPSRRFFYVGGDQDIMKEPDQVSWEEMEAALRKTYSAFPGGAELVDAALKEGWILTEKQEHIPTLGFSMAAETSRAQWTGSHSYIYMPFDGSVFSALAVAHELGHAFQQEETLLYNRGTNIRNLALAESFAMVTEHLMERALLDGVEDPERKMKIAKCIAVREGKLVNKVAIYTRLGNDLMEEVVSGRTEPFSAAEIKARGQKHVDAVQHEEERDIFPPNEFLTEGLLYGYTAALAPSHGMASLAARAWADRYVGLPKNKRKEMAAEWVEVMRDALDYETDVAGAFARAGVDMKAPGFLKATTEYPKRLLERVAAETGLPVPDEAFREAGGEGKFAANENKRRKQESSMQRVRG